jgi:hypothetical protein
LSSSSSSSSSRRKRKPSPPGPGHLCWTDLRAEPGSQVAWEQLLPKITCREMTIFTGISGNVPPFPNWVWRAGSLDRSILKQAHET